MFCDEIFMCQEACLSGRDNDWGLRHSRSKEVSPNPWYNGTRRFEVAVSVRGDGEEGHQHHLGLEEDEGPGVPEHNSFA